MHADYFTCPGKSRVGSLMKRLLRVVALCSAGPGHSRPFVHVL